MIYRELGKTGLKVSIVGFGGTRFFYGDEAVAAATVRRAFERGVNFFETGSYGEGKSEVLLGKGLAGIPRDKVILANKAHVFDLPSAAKVREKLEASLKREGVDYFDLFSFWGVNRPDMFEHVMKGGPLEAALKAKDEGLIRHIGFTTHATPENIAKFAQGYDWAAVTLKEHILYSRHQEVLAGLAKRRIGAIIMSPLAGGVVAKPEPEIAAELVKEGMTAAVLGLRFLVSNPNVTTAICGFTRPEEADGNVKAGETGAPLSDAEKRLVKLIQEKTAKLGGKFCTSCGYCTPCPNGVNVPAIFRLWNIMRGWGNEEYSKLEYQKICEERHWADFGGRSADKCAECGNCEEKCPEKLPIIEDLKKAHKELTENWPK